MALLLLFLLAVKKKCQLSLETHVDIYVNSGQPSHWRLEQLGHTASLIDYHF